MHPLEIVSRAGEQAKRARARGKLEGWARYALPGPIPVLPGLREQFLANADQRTRSAIEAAAQAVLAGRYEALGVRWPERSPDGLFPPEVWRLDPVTGGLWPGADAYCFDISYRHERTLGDIKYVWEFNRLQFLQPLAAHYALSRDRRALEAVEQAIDSWFEANPPFRGIAWNSGIELALRSISVLVAVTLCGEAMSKAAIERARTLLNAHAFWMARYPSRFSSANNHLVAEAAGEFLIALAMPEAPGAARREAHARKVLEDEAHKQILADGVGAEQSPTYGAFTAEFILLSAVVARAAGRALTPGVDQRLRAFADFIGWLAGPDGRTPAIGDDDEGRVLSTGSHEHAYASSVAAAVAGYLGGPSPVPRPAGGELRDACFGSPEKATDNHGVKTFVEGGYSVVRERRAGHELHLVFDHGPLGYLSIAAHGHADALAFTLALDGEPILIDAGTYLYHSGGPWRDWFRGTAAHNTLTVAEQNQSSIAGPFNWTHKAAAALETGRGGEEWRLAGSHDGYLKRFGLRHRRVLEASKDGLSIIDELVGGVPRTDIAIRLLVSPACSLEPRSDGMVLSLGGKPRLLVSPDASGELEWRAGGDIGEGGWASPCFGEKVPAAQLVWRPRGPSRLVETRLTILP